MSPFELGAWGPTNKLRLMTIGGEPERGPSLYPYYGRPTGCSYHFFSQAVSAPVHRHPSLAGGACGLKGERQEQEDLDNLFSHSVATGRASRAWPEIWGAYEGYIRPSEG